jgi:hypothetical protein
VHAHLQKQFDRVSIGLQLILARYSALTLNININVKKTYQFKSSDNNLAARVSSKLEDGDISGAIRLASSNDSIAHSMTSRPRQFDRNILPAPCQIRHHLHLVPTNNVCSYWSRTSSQPSNRSCQDLLADLMAYVHNI